MTAGRTLRREVRVALSRRAQPVWFRVTKWVVVLIGGRMLWGTPYFWTVLFSAFGLALALHAFWRWKTKGWTEPWGGWDDIDTAGRE